MKSRQISQNPVLALPAVDRLRDLPPEVRSAVADILVDLGADAAAKAEYSWRKNKGPMAAYWKAVGVYSRHIARAIR
ncbi:hypothetical protein [Ferrovibrio sp.]|uniref:hypothetical protein n=1 Tax=Ferrovibrio sp. TaxID=1917215 RepID=UPI003D0EA91A